ncbi:GP46-like surface antigen, putative [Bodo saltans]|uniref:GP46-like surface antigen, putative n=1 Tax=Bodo saltans TaxID=75058 RepID=A0A0S4JV52_BODSA|nr:GP46-like surface antigen, putative [Bodo saltans]|eukprot:CUG93918.1 GP46-like surface antigen, putative [Bodo saltans]
MTSKTETKRVRVYLSIAKLTLMLLYSSLISLFVAPTASAATTCACVHRSDVLSDLYRSTNGPFWTTKWNVLAADFPCAQPGVTCNDTISDITDLVLVDFGLNGTLPASLGNLTALYRFDVSTNALRGSLPASFGNWQRIAHFNATLNQLSGSLPPSYSAWTRMVLFLVFSNSLTGTLPPDYGKWGPTTTVFAVNGNQFNGTLPPEYSNWTTMTSFVVYENNLTGTLPDQYTSWLNSIQNFNIRNNRFTGTLPAVYKVWNTPFAVHVSHNAFHGSLPSEYGRWRSIVEFSVANNNFSGTFPPSYGNFSQLKQFYINDNSFTGELPLSYSAWNNINTAHLFNNKLHGTFPPEYSQWRSAIKTLDASRNNLSGTLPKSYDNWTSMVSFTVALNSLSGSLPAEYSAWTSLQTFKVYSNQLSGTLPYGYAAWKNSALEINFSNNNFSGAIPSSYIQFLSLSTFAASLNSLSGVIPPDLVAVPTMRYFSVGDNQLAGLLPATVSPLMIFFDVQNNSGLRGALPQTLSASMVMTCNTQITCPTTVFKYCFPHEFMIAFWEIPRAEILVASAPHRVAACSATPAPPPTPGPPVQLTPSLEAPFRHVSTRFDTFQTATAALTYGVLVSTVGRGALPSVQRSTSALRLARRCAADSAGGAAQSEDLPPPLFDSPADNPLLLSLPAGVGKGSESLDFATGAVVGNTIVVIVSAILLQCIRVTHLCFSGEANRTLSNRILTLLLGCLPSARFLGGMSVLYAALLQPTVGACISLIVSPARDARSIACGALLLILWIAYSIVCVYFVLVAGRRVPTPSTRAHAGRKLFLLRAVETPSAPMKQKNKEMRKNARASLLNIRALSVNALKFLFTSSSEWVVRQGQNRRSVKNDEMLERSRIERFLLRNLINVFDAYIRRREWYFLVEWSVGFASGAILGAAEALAATADDSSSSSCDIAQWGVACAIALGVVELVLCAALRPFAVRMDTVSVATIGVLGVTCSSLAMSSALLDESASVGVVANVLALVFLVLAIVNGVHQTASRDTTGMSSNSPEPSEKIEDTLTKSKKVESSKRSVLKSPLLLESDIFIPAAANYPKYSNMRTDRHKTDVLYNLIQLVCDSKAAQKSFRV